MIEKIRWRRKKIGSLDKKTIVNDFGRKFFKAYENVVKCEDTMKGIAESNTDVKATYEQVRDLRKEFERVHKKLTVVDHRSIGMM